MKKGAECGLDPFCRPGGGLVGLGVVGEEEDGLVQGLGLEVKLGGPRAVSKALDVVALEAGQHVVQGLGVGAKLVAGEGQPEAQAGFLWEEA